MFAIKHQKITLLLATGSHQIYNVTKRQTFPKINLRRFKSISVYYGRHLLYRLCPSLGQFIYKTLTIKNRVNYVHKIYFLI